MESRNRSRHKVLAGIARLRKQSFDGEDAYSPAATPEEIRAIPRIPEEDPDFAAITDIPSAGSDALPPLGRESASRHSPLIQSGNIPDLVSGIVEVKLGAFYSLVQQHFDELKINFLARHNDT